MAAHLSFRGKWARRVVRTKLYHELRKLNAVSHENSHAQLRASLPFLQLDDAAGPDNLPKDPRRESDGSFSRSHVIRSLPTASKVCIVGAGVAGLYIAMILDSLQIPNLSYEILEAADRSGGRMYTHYFSQTPHDYYDIGAMRYPELKIMNRTFDLFRNRLGLGDKLIKYYLDPTENPNHPTPPEDQGSVRTPSRFNDITYVTGDPQVADVFRISVQNGGSVPDATVAKGVSGVLNDAFGVYKDAMQKDFKKGFEMLLEVDEYSTREYIRTKLNYDFFSIQWLETMNTSSGLFDQAFSESVIDSFDFDAPGNGLEQWLCIDGGTSLVTKAMEECIHTKVELRKRVNKISMDGPDAEHLTVQVAGESAPRDPYITVFNTTSLGCLQRIDLTGLQLHPSQKDAIRCLHYDHSTKVAIKFSYPWWIKDCGITFGGTGNTDLPIRTCVYPSYNLKDPLDKPSVLLCSYTWAQDATRIGSLVRPEVPTQEELRELLIDNLAKLHLKNFVEAQPSIGTGVITLDVVRKIIADAWLKHHAFAWPHDPHTSGAFALFGPGQFANLYPYLSRPTAGSKFHFVGEASSAHHAWIVGALDSAYAAVHRFLNKFGLLDHMHQLEEEWGKKVGDVADIESGWDGTEHLQIALGMLAEGQHVRV